MTVTRSKEICIKVASHLSEWNQGLRLLHERLVSWGLTSSHPSKLWLHKYLLLPTTTLIVAKSGSDVVGAIVLIGSGAFGLPIKKNYFGNLTLSANGEDPSPDRIAEVSPAAVVRGLETLVALPLLQYAFQYSATYCHHELVIAESWNNESAGFWQKLGLQALPRQDGSRMAVFAQAPSWLVGQDVFDHVKDRATCYYPDRKFFKASDSTITPEIMQELFIKQSGVLHALSDQELRAIRNIYGFGPLSALIPLRNSQEHYHKQPRFPRFDVNCDGFLVLPNSEEVCFTVKDVSSKGLRIRSEHPLRLGETYVMHVRAGLWHQSEVIARAVWCNEDNIIGLELENADTVWQEMIDHLKATALPAA